MKILRIIARLNIGGPARNAVLLSEGFSTRPATKGSAKKWDSPVKQGQSLFFAPHPNPLPKGEREVYWETVLVCGEVGEGEGDMGYLAREKGIEPVIVPELGRELSFRNDWRAFWKIYRIICRERPDIVHTHTAKAGALGRMAGVVCNIRWMRLLASLRGRSGLRGRAIAGAPRNDKRIILVHTFHGHVLHGYFGKIKSWVFLWIEKILAVFTDKIVTVSEALKKELVEEYRIAPEGKFSVVELGFELDELLKLPMKEASDVINIGIVGRLVPVKNHKMVLRVASCLSKKMGQSHKAGTVPIFCPKFIIIGDGELRRELEAYVKKLGIADIVEFRGWVKDVAEIYRDLDIVVLTSLNEGTPVSIIEAMAAARPVVATKVGGVGDVVEDERTGYLVASGDEEKFSEKLLDLINHPEKRKIFGECGRKAVKDRFSKERLIKDMEKVYREIARLALRAKRASAAIDSEYPRNDVVAMT